MEAVVMQLQLSPLDNSAVQEALKLRRTMIMPDSEGSETSSEEGEVLAEICRGWLEMLGKPISGSPTSTVNQPVS